MTYVYSILAVVMLLMGVSCYVLYLQLDNAKTSLAFEKSKTAQLEQSIKEQQKIIADLDKQNEIISRNLTALQFKFNKLEDDYVESIRETDKVVDEAATQETKDAEKSLNNNINRIFDRLENVSK